MKFHTLDAPDRKEFLLTGNYFQQTLVERWILEHVAPVEPSQMSHAVLQGGQVERQLRRLTGVKRNFNVSTLTLQCFFTTRLDHLNSLFVGGPKLSELSDCD